MKLFLDFLRKNRTSIIVLGLSCFFVFYGILDHDAISDEAINGFRAIGYYDHLVSQLQTTPYQWFDEVPIWAKLSFHDHPYVSFLLQHILFSVFGMSLFIMRLPFALAGILLVLLLFLIFRKFVDGRRAWLPALLLLFNAYHLWSARQGYLEILTSFFIWLSVYFFFKAKFEAKNFYLWGFFLGLALASKYTAFFILPVYAIYILIFERNFLKQKSFWFSCLIALLIFTPVIIYNICMFGSTGHFDMQFSALFGQEVEAWSNISRGTATNLSGMWQNFVKLVTILLSSWGMINLVFFTVSFIYLIVLLFMKKQRIVSWLVLMVLVLAIGFVLIGPEQRFLSLFNPLWAGVVALACLQLRSKKVFLSVVCLLLVFNLLRSFNIHYVVGWLGENKLWYSQQLVLKNYGYNELERILQEIIKTEKPYMEIDENGNMVLRKSEDNTLIVFDSNINYFPKIWYMQRYFSYRQVNFASTDELLLEFKDKLNVLEAYDKFYFIKATANTFLVPEKAKNNTAQILEKNLIDGAVTVWQEVKTKKGELAFKIYKF